MGDPIPPLIQICCSPPIEAGVIPHLIYFVKAMFVPICAIITRPFTIYTIAAQLSISFIFELTFVNQTILLSFPPFCRILYSTPLPPPRHSPTVRLVTTRPIIGGGQS